MPRRYRPPAAKRRKPRRATPQTPSEQPVAPSDGESAIPTSAEDYDEEWDEDEEFEDEPAAAVATAVRPAAGKERTQHLQRDFTYVRTELIRVGVVASFLVISLIITAVLR